MTTRPHEPTTHTQHLLLTALEASVMLEIMDLERQGGITDWHVQQIQSFGETLGSEGDTIQYKVKGKTARNFARLCEAVAVLAFMPGGINFMNLHFEGKPVYGMPSEEAEKMQGQLDKLKVEVAIGE